MQRIHIIGGKNSGKTTLIVELVRHFTEQGIRVGTIKHTHHHHELDTPGKDSHRHRQAGAAVVGILSPAMNAVFWPQENAAKTSTAPVDRYATFDGLMDDCRIVLVEGDQSTSAPKLEVFRQEVREQPLAQSDPTIRAIISDDPVTVDMERLPRNNLPAIAEFLLDID